GRRNQQQHQVAHRRARKHIADKSLVPRHVDKAKANTVFFENRKAEIDRYPAPLFFFETVRMCSGQGLDQRRLAVVNVPGRADDDALWLVRHGTMRRENLQRSSPAPPALDTAPPPPSS